MKYEVLDDMAASNASSESLATDQQIGGVLDVTPGEPVGRQGELSKDLLLILFKGLSIHELALVLLVSRAWRTAALDPILPAWRSLTADTFRLMCPAMQNEEHGVFRGKPVSVTRAVRGSAQCHSSSVAHVVVQQRGIVRWMPPSLMPGGQLSRQALERAFMRCPTELDLSALSSRVDDELLIMVGRQCPGLKGLRLHDSCSFSSCVSTRGVLNLAGLCAGLVSLDISFTDVSDRGIAGLTALTQLKSLRMHNCTRVTGSSLPPLLAQSSKLEQVSSPHLGFVLCIQGH